MQRPSKHIALVVAFFLLSTMTASAQAHPTEQTDSARHVFIDYLTMPSFRGGIAGLQEYLRKMVVYPPKCVEDSIEGRVVVSFVVEKDGSISNAKVVKSVDPRLDCEALRAVWHMPKWIPGKEMGKCVRVKYALPVTFRLSDLEKEQKAQPSNAQGVDARKPAATPGNKQSDHRLPNR